MVQDDPKLPDDSEEVSKPNGMVGGLIPNREVFSLLDKKKSHVIKHLLCSKTNQK
jgi:hypothetical protein